MYEGRTRGKRLRYTFSDEEDFDSDNVGARRSTRTSGRETPAVPSGPTVTASGRQVRSRATGLYGETLLSGQVSDRASPTTGDYVRSDASEEPQQAHAHGRATRNANRGATNGRPLKHSLESDDEEDATSWDGGDEDEDEPEQMELDDDEDEQAEDSSEDEDEQQSLVVTLRYGKGSSKPSNGDLPANDDMLDAAPTTVIKHEGLQPTESTLASTDAPQQPEHIPAPMEPAIQPAPPAHPVAAFAHDHQTHAAYIPHGIPVLQQQSAVAPVVPAAEHTHPVGNPAVLPELDGMFPAPEQPPAQYPNGQPVQRQAALPTQQAPFPPQQQLQLPQPTLPSPTPAANWQ